MQKTHSDLGFLAAVALVLNGCASQIVSRVDSSYSVDDFARVEKIDAHVHANVSDPAFMNQALADNFKLLSINVDYPDFPAIDLQREASLSLREQFGDAFQFAGTFSMDSWTQESWQSDVIEEVDLAAEQGAVGIKVWKNIGMSYRDSEGNLVMIDDASFDPVFDHLAAIGMPLIGHQGEPHNCWLPLDQMTVNNDRQYFAAHPQYHMYLHPEMPSYEDQMDARNRMLDKNIGLPFMGAHMASLEWSLDEIGVFLDRYPDAVIDLAARMGQVQYHSGLDRENVREFFIQYQDRILYASDLTSMPDSDPEVFAASVHAKWLDDWAYLNTAEQFRVPEVDHMVIGLELPKSVIDKVYRLNAERFFAW